MPRVRYKRSARRLPWRKQRELNHADPKRLREAADKQDAVAEYYEAEMDAPAHAEQARSLAVRYRELADTFEVDRGLD